MNTSENIKVNQPQTKDWDDMTPDEQATERRRAQALRAEAEKPDPQFDRNIDSLVKSMEKVFGAEDRHPVILFQITQAMKAAGHTELPPLICGINGYNFIVPRGVPINVPVSLIHVLYNAGEVNAQTMMAYGLLSPEVIEHDMAESKALLEKLAALGGVVPS